ncbi:MAG: YdeI/OmpD-associated family protein [Gemmatimonadaceae bacterium]
MPPVIPNPANIHEFKSEAEFERWLAKNHATATEVWIKLHKKGSGLPSVTNHEALDVVLCWGWIDGIRKSFDDKSFLQRYSPRKARSIWSKINTDHIARLEKVNRMQAPGHVQVDLAKADGRWVSAYSGSAAMKIPHDFAAALKKSKTAQAMYDTLNSQNRYALSFRLGNIKTEATRARKIVEYVAMLERGESIYPNKSTSVLRTEAIAGGRAASVKRPTSKPKSPTKRTLSKKTATKKDASTKVPFKNASRKSEPRKIVAKAATSKKSKATKSSART